MMWTDFKSTYSVFRIRVYQKGGRETVQQFCLVGVLASPSVRGSLRKPSALRSERRPPVPQTGSVPGREETWGFRCRGITGGHGGQGVPAAVESYWVLAG